MAIHGHPWPSMAIAMARRFQGPRAHKIQAVDPLCVSAVSPKSQGHQLQLPLLVGFFRFLGFFGMVYYRIIHGNTCFFLTIENGMINDHLLVGGDWNHGILRVTFPSYWEWNNME